MVFILGLNLQEICMRYTNFKNLKLTKQLIFTISIILFTLFLSSPYGWVNNQNYINISVKEYFKIFSLLPWWVTRLKVFLYNEKLVIDPCIHTDVCFFDRYISRSKHDNFIVTLYYFSLMLNSSYKFILLDVCCFNLVFLNPDQTNDWTG